MKASMHRKALLIAIFSALVSAAVITLHAHFFVSVDAMQIQMHAALLGNVRDVTGVPVPQSALVEPVGLVAVERPTILTLGLPDHPKISFRVRALSLNIDRGIIVDAYLLPLENPVPFTMAVSELRRCMKELGVRPTVEMQREIESWPADVPSASSKFHPDTYRASCNISDMICFYVLLRPHPQGGWYLSLSYSATAEARRKIWENQKVGNHAPADNSKGSRVNGINP